MKVSDTPTKYEMFYESGKDEGGDFFRCLKCGARNYYSVDAGGLQLQKVKEAPTLPRPAMTSQEMSGIGRAVIVVAEVLGFLFMALVTLLLIFG